MIVLVIDFSKKKSFKKNSLILGLNLWRIKNRIYVGNLPLRVIQKMLKDIRSTATKCTSVATFSADKKSHTGWRVQIVGVGELNEFLSPFVADVKIKEKFLNAQIKELREKNRVRNGSGLQARVVVSPFE